MQIKLTVSNLSFFVTIRSGFVFVYSNGFISVTIQNYTRVSMNFFFLSVTDTVTSENIHLFLESPCIVWAV